MRSFLLLVFLATVTTLSTNVLADDASVDRVLARARLEVERHVAYDSAYRALTFKDGVDTGRRLGAFGDVDPSRGVCTDVVIRALRAAGIDLQSRLHADIGASPRSYPDVVAPDANIDHRRVRPLLEYFDRHASRFDPNPRSNAWRPGDLVIWAFEACPRCTPNHIGMISDRIGPRGLPLVIHNIGPAPTEDDVLDEFVILRHFRVIDALR